MTLISFERNIIRPVNISTSGTCHSKRKKRHQKCQQNFSVFESDKAGQPRHFPMPSNLIVPTHQRRISCVIGLECVRTTREKTCKNFENNQIERPILSRYRQIRSPRLTKGADDHMVSSLATWLVVPGWPKGAEDDVSLCASTGSFAPGWQKVRVTIRYPRMSPDSMGQDDKRCRRRW